MRKNSRAPASQNTNTTCKLALDMTYHLRHAHHARQNRRWHHRSTRTTHRHTPIRQRLPAPRPTRQHRRHHQHSRRGGRKTGLRPLGVKWAKQDATACILPRVTPERLQARRLLREDSPVAPPPATQTP